MFIFANKQRYAISLGRSLHLQGPFLCNLSKVFPLSNKITNCPRPYGYRRRYPSQEDNASPPPYGYRKRYPSIQGASQLPQQTIPAHTGTKNRTHHKREMLHHTKNHHFAHMGIENDTHHKRTTLHTTNTPPHRYRKQYPSNFHFLL